jgi:phosphatidylserine/phosphatidylglycerophosphate/cardiolipin synthase-like enzyme
MKKLFSILVLSLGLINLVDAQNTILEARQMPEGSIVTIKGIVTNGSELGVIRYIQDNTAGIAAYFTANQASTVNKGDSVTVTGTTVLYNQLLELNPITSVIVRSSGNPLPEPVLLTPSQISEPYESMLVKIENANFKDAGLVFAGNKKYEFTANDETGYIYVKTGQDLVGTTIPNALTDITAICSQYDFANPAGGYQLLPRSLTDLYISSSIYLTGTLINTGFNKTTLDFSWTTNIAGSTGMFYGSSPQNVTDHVAIGNGLTTDHIISITGLSAGTITWVKAFSISGNDTAWSAVHPFATISNSGGDIKVYFNNPVDITYSKGVDAVYLPETIDDTLIRYIERAKYSIDFTIYNFNNDGISNISYALKEAANRGVDVRVIGCGTTNNSGIDELIGSAVHLLIGPDANHRDGIMHNKFIVFDAESTNPYDPIVWTGSTNFTDGQINLDANNVIIIQDQSLARTFKIEFEEMWGSDNNNANAGNARFGSTKKNNTPHEFIINNKRVECYFSPTDGVNSQIVNTINTADNDMSIATMLITRTEMATAIANRKSAGVATNVITNNQSGNSTAVNDILNAALNVHYTNDSISGGILHNKYMIVDQDAPASDPLVLTGSHNWSASADNINDENTVVIHDATIANIYYQNFAKRFVDNLGVLFEITGPPTAVNDIAETGTDQLITISVLDNDIKQAPVTITIAENASNGNSYIPFSNSNVINYEPLPGFTGKDSLTYKISYNVDPSLFSQAKVYITVAHDFGINEPSGKAHLEVLPNPVSNGNLSISINTSKAENVSMQLLDITGKVVFSSPVYLRAGNNILDYKLDNVNKGIYTLKIIKSDCTLNKKLILK